MWGLGLGLGVGLGEGGCLALQGVLGLWLRLLGRSLPCLRLKDVRNLRLGGRIL